MTKAAIFLFFSAYALLLLLVAGIAAAGIYAGILMITTAPPLLIVAAGAGLIGFGLLMLFYFIKFLFDGTKVDKVVSAIITAAALTLASACFVVGAWAMIKQPGIISIAAGLALIAGDILVLFFFIRLLSGRSKSAGGVAISKAEQPELFAFIEQVTNRQMKIFVSPDVKINIYSGRIELGLGLVNSLNISEFKAIIAQEFKYYKQRRVYLIYTALYDNTRYKSYNFLGSFAKVANSIGKVIQRLLLGVYKLINKSHLTESHEIVFRADEYAADIAGGNNLATALDKIEIGAGSYAKALNAAATTFMVNKKISRNVYNNQLTVFHSMVEECQFASARVHYKDMWTSYPTLAERKLRLNSAAATDNTSAMDLFNNANDLQEVLTAKLYRAIEHAGFQFYDAAEFDAWYLKDKMPAVYKGFYSNRYLDIIDWDLKVLAEQPVSIKLDDLNGQLQSIIAHNEKDIATLKTIHSSFDFDGKRYLYSDANMIIAQLQAETISLKEKQSQQDKEAFAYFYQQHHEVMALYQHYQSLQQQQHTFSETTAEIIRLINTIYSETSTQEEIQSAMHKITSLEVVIKEVMQSITPASPDINHYLQTQHTYFNDKGLNHEALYALRGVLTGKISALEEVQHAYYRKMIKEQLHF